MFGVLRRNYHNYNLSTYIGNGQIRICSSVGQTPKKEALAKQQTARLGAKVLGSVVRSNGGSRKWLERGNTAEEAARKLQEACCGCRLCNSLTITLS